jgi:NitT/TauT family transport system permease protein
MIRRSWLDWASPLATFAVTLALWEAVIRFLEIPTYFIPAPSAVVRALINGRDIYAVHFAITIMTTFVAFAIAFVLGVAMGTLVSEVKLISRTLYPLLVALQAMPRVALAPIIIVWFGFGVSSKIVLGAFSAFFPVFLNTVHGLGTADQDQVALMRTFRATRWQIFWRIKLPNALPFVLAGANIGVIFAMLAVIVGEFLGANRGMGYLIVNQSNLMDTAGVFANVTLLSAAGLVFHYGLQALRRALLFWAAESEAAGANV